jgi:CRISPR/Cas system-associated exonuclease Cas4 (RecB family)
MLVEKFIYPSLKRIQTDAGRQYTDGTGSPVPSVTTVLDSTADKTALFEWKKRVGEVEAQRISTESAGLGTKVHNALEKFILGEEWDTFGNNHVSVLARAMAKEMITHGLLKVNEVWGTEVGLLADGLYAGTSDCVGVYNNQDAIIDFKTSKKLKKREWIEDYFLQGCAYALAHNEMFGTNIRKVVILMVDREANFGEYIIKDDEFDQYAALWGHRLAAYYNL